jgi:hypothetical protein
MIPPATSFQGTKSVNQRLPKTALLVKLSRCFQGKLRICLAGPTLQIICSFFMCLSEETILDDDLLNYTFECPKLENI